MKLGELIRKKREEKNLTLIQLSQMTGISSAYLNRIEKGERRNPSIAMMQALIDALDINQEELKHVYGDTSQWLIKEDGKEQLLLKKLRQLKGKNNFTFDDILSIMLIIKDIINDNGEQ